MSISRSHKRKYKKAAKGAPIPLHKRKVIEAHQNEGGFYEGMPGVTVDELGNRRIIDFVVTPEGYETARVYAHPKIMKLAVQKACENNKELGGIILGAAIDNVFQNSSFLHWLIRLGLKRRRNKSIRKMEKAQKVSEKKEV